jgi:hypothetical protein
MRYFLDCEFDGFHGPLMSLALVREDGEGVYLLTDHEAAEPWVRENVVPFLLDCPQKPFRGDARELGDEIADFMEGDVQPLIVSDWPADIRYLCEMIEFEGGQMADIRTLAFQMVRCNAYPTTLPGAVQHNAWWDAMALRHKLMHPNTAA